MGSLPWVSSHLLRAIQLAGPRFELFSGAPLSASGMMLAAVQYLESVDHKIIIEEIN